MKYTQEQINKARQKATVCLELASGTNITEIIDMLVQFKLTLTPDEAASCDLDIEYEGTNAHMEAYRLETDQEVIDRLQRTEQREAQVRERELAQLRALQAKYLKG